MDVERIRDEMEQIQEMFEASESGHFSASDISAARPKHDEMLAGMARGSGCGSILCAADLIGIQ